MQPRFALLPLLMVAASLWGADPGGEFTALEVRIAAPANLQGNRNIPFHNGAARFEVVLHNRSTKPVQLFREWCSWGWFNLSFEVIAADGTVTAVRKSQKDWGKNFPDLVILQANDVMVIPVGLNAEEWKDPPLPAPGTSRTVGLRAIYQVGPDKGNPTAWAGKAVSETLECTLWR